MNNLLFKTSAEDELLEAVRRTCFRLWSYLGADVWEEDSLTWISSTVSYALFNRVIAFDSTQITQELIQSVNTYFSKKGVSYSWLVQSDNVDIEFRRSFAKNRLIHHEPFIGMAFDNSLSNYNRLLDSSFFTSPARAPHITIREGFNLIHIETWMSILQRSMNMTRQATRQCWQIHKERWISSSNPSKLRYYIGYINNVPVCCGNMLVDGNNAGIYNIGTIPEYRGQGAAKTLVSSIVQNALDRGVSQIVLLSTPMARNLYTKLGFYELLNFQRYFP